MGSTPSCHQCLLLNRSITGVSWAFFDLYLRQCRFVQKRQWGHGLGTGGSAAPGRCGRSRPVDRSRNSSTMYTLGGGGVFRSTDGGASWNALSSGQTTQQFTSLAMDPWNPGTLYAGTAGGGVSASPSSTETAANRRI